MLDFLQSLPNIKLFLVIAASGLLISTVIPFLIRWRLQLHPNEHLAKGANESFKFAISVTLLLCAFSLVRVQGDHRNAEDLVAREAALTHKLNGALTAFGGADATELVTDLKNYSESVVQDEWPLMTKGQRSDKTTELLGDLTQGIRLLTPKNAVQQMARVEIGVTIGQLNDIREARLAAAKLSLPAYLIQALAFAFGLLVLLGWFQNPLPAMLAYVGGVTIGFAVLVTLLIQAGSLFIGESQVTTSTISNVLN